MKTFAIALCALLGFLLTTAPVQAQRKFDVPPHPPAGWSGPIGAPPKKDKDNPKKDKDNPKKDKDNPKKDKDSPKKNPDDSKPFDDQLYDAINRCQVLRQVWRDNPTAKTLDDYWQSVLKVQHLSMQLQDPRNP